MISKRRHYAVVITEIYHNLSFVGILLWLIISQYQQKWTNSFPVFFFSAIITFALLLNIRGYLHSIKIARDRHISLVQAIYELVIDNRMKSLEIKQPKPIKGRLRYFAAWTLPAIFGVPLLILAVSFPILIVTKPTGESMLALSLVELPLIGGLLWIGYLIYVRKLEAKRLNVSLTDSMIVMFERWEIRRQERLVRPSTLSKKTRYFLNFLGFSVGVALIYSDLLSNLQVYVLTPAAIRQMLIILAWVWAVTCPLNMLTLYTYGESGERPVGES